MYIFLKVGDLFLKPNRLEIFVFFFSVLIVNLRRFYLIQLSSEVMLDF